MASPFLVGHGERGSPLVVPPFSPCLSFPSEDPSRRWVIVVVLLEEELIRRGSSSSSSVGSSLALWWAAAAALARRDGALKEVDLHSWIHGDRKQLHLAASTPSHRAPSSSPRTSSSSWNSEEGSSSSPQTSSSSWPPAPAFSRFSHGC